ncbi:MAG: T9SS type A sorting domain-containing protein [Algibacter sp.]|uniref:T9SS type A sorting domain-containing protein n=1 Tax=Algibacter sp. TaxID=1872428 RepID=UPI00329A5D1F
MKKQLLFTATLLFAAIFTYAQNTWYDFDGGVTDVSITTATNCTDCTISTVANPDAGDTANATNVTLLELAAASPGEASNRGFIINFPTGKGINDADVNGLTVTLRIYLNSFDNYSNFDNAERFRFYLASSSGMTSTQEQINFVSGDTGVWKDYTFTYNATATGFIDSAEIRLIGQAARFTNLDNGLKIYIDTITATLPLTSDTSLSTNEINSQEAKISTYPNPVVNSFQINSSVNVENVKLYNITGRLLKTFTAKSNYDINDLATGIYIANIKTDSGSKTLKIVKK